MLLLLCVWYHLHVNIRHATSMIQVLKLHMFVNTKSCENDMKNTLNIYEFTNLKYPFKGFVGE